MSAARADTYLTLPDGYATLIGGLRWSAIGDAVERWNGTTVALTEELGVVLEGVFARRPVPPYVVVLHVLHLMRSDDSSPVSARLRAAYREARGAAGLLRNAGVLIAELCRDVPPAAGVPPLAEVDAARCRRRLFGEAGYPVVAEEPALSPAAVEEKVAARLEALTDEDLRHWLAHGCAPGAAGDRLAAEVESLPARVAQLLALARTRPRLVGAAAVVPAVDAALTLPPRRRSPDTLPQGGYTDVTTRGDPDRLLPSQFALDPDEFVRRFADRELLYFLREEPQATVKPDRLVVLDQGVRTWGPVRLALAAAAVVLLRKDARRVGRVLLAATSADRVLDVATADPAVVAGVLEASDLTENPRACWEASLAVAADAPRDVVLLTHPRTARDPALLAVERRPGDRVFALTVADDGAAELAEWGAAGPVGLRSFRVDLVAAEAARVEAEGAPRPTIAGEFRTTTAWTGDVEPVGFPFRPGLVAEPSALGFDAAGEWLVVTGPQGVLHGLALDGNPAEVLPRAMSGGAVLKHVDAVLGLAGGVAVCGRLDPGRTPQVGVTLYPPGAPVLTSTASDAPAPGPAWVVAYYDREVRRVTVYRLRAAIAGGRWSAFPDLNCVAVRVPEGAGGYSAVVDLTAGAEYPDYAITGVPSERRREAVRRSAQGGSPPFPLPVTTSDSPGNTPKDGGPYLLRRGDEITVRCPDLEWRPFAPQRDGKPLLAVRDIARAQLAGDVLALAVSRGPERSLVFFRGPGERGIGEVPHPHPYSPFALSPDGTRVARLHPSRAVSVHPTDGPNLSLAIASPAGLHNNLAIRLEGDPFRLYLRVGSFAHRLTVNAGELEHMAVSGSTNHPAWPPPLRPMVVPTGYDPARFPIGEAVAAGPWTAVLDRLGQVLIFAGRAPAPVAAVVVRRELVAVWAPPNLFWGSTALIGGPPTPGAARAIADALTTGGE
jgi:hypothetical protein